MEKIIKNYGDYAISDKGEVRNRLTNKILKPSLDKGGYLKVNLRKDGKTYTKTLHRLVAEAFIENPNNFLDVNHKDEDKTNNNVCNLEWCSRQYNINYGTRTARCSKKVLQYDLDNNLINTFPSLHEAARVFNYSESSISSCCNGRYATAYGYKWRYAT